MQGDRRGRGVLGAPRASRCPSGSPRSPRARRAALPSRSASLSQSAGRRTRRRRTRVANDDLAADDAAARATMMNRFTGDAARRAARGSLVPAAARAPGRRQRHGRARRRPRRPPPSAPTPPPSPSARPRSRRGWRPPRRRPRRRRRRRRPKRTSWPSPKPRPRRLPLARSPPSRRPKEAAAREAEEVARLHGVHARGGARRRMGGGGDAIAPPAAQMRVLVSAAVGVDVDDGGPRDRRRRGATRASRRSPEDRRFVKIREQRVSAATEALYDVFEVRIDGEGNIDAISRAREITAAQARAPATRSTRTARARSHAFRKWWEVREEREGPRGTEEALQECLQGVMAQQALTRAAGRYLAPRVARIGRRRRREADAARRASSTTRRRRPHAVAGEAGVRESAAVRQSAYDGRALVGEKLLDPERSNQKQRARKAMRISALAPF